MSYEHFHPDFEGRPPDDISTTGLIFRKDKVPIFRQVASVMGNLGMDLLTIEEFLDRVNPAGMPLKENQVIVRIINKTGEDLGRFWDIADPAYIYSKDLAELGLPEKEEQTLLNEFIKRRATDIKENKDPFRDVLE